MGNVTDHLKKYIKDKIWNKSCLKYVSQGLKHFVVLFFCYSHIHIYIV